MNKNDIEKMKEYIIEKSNESGETFDLAAVLGLHFQKCEPCRIEYFKDMEKATMKVVNHIQKSENSTE